MCYNLYNIHGFLSISVKWGDIMVFTTQIFTFIFLPICVLAYLIVDRLSALNKLSYVLNKIRARDIILILFSLGFYAWACFDNVVRLCVYIITIYLLSTLIGYIKVKGQYIFINSSIGIKKFYLSKIPFAISLVFVIFFLVYYNYSSFLIELWNKLLGDSLTPKSIVAPLGLSFITFSSVSYLVDIYQGKADRGSLIDCFLYLTFFPKIISGPIVLYRDFKEQAVLKKITANGFSDGINLIITGFAKKVILADTFGSCQASLENIDRITAIGIPILYMLQIYYDFSGYSDIAIGVSKLFGFNFKNNFNFPYRSKSISEFWRRWHISLGTWFRTYVYFPFGGSRAGFKRTLLNLGVVFALTGIWHGAGWNYILWGAINGGLVILERVISNKKIYLKTPNFIKYSATMLIVMMFWLLFKYQSIGEICTLFKTACGMLKYDVIPFNWRYYYDLRAIVLAVIGIIGATAFGSPRLKMLQDRLASTKIGYFIEEIFLFVLFAVSVLFMVNSTYSPFIYFQY